MQIGLISIGGRAIGTITLERADAPLPSYVPKNSMFQNASLDASDGYSAEASSYGRSGPGPGHNQPSSGEAQQPPAAPRPNRFGGEGDTDPRPETHPAVSGARVHGRLASARDRARQELADNPRLNEKAMHIFAGENPDPTASTALWESAINRMAVRGTTLSQELRRTNEGGYYEGWRDEVSPSTRKVLEASRDKALAYSNVSNYATDNSSGNLAARENASGTFTEKSVYNREHFFGPDNRIASHQRSYNDLVRESEVGRVAAGSNDTASPALPPTGKAITGDTPRGFANLMHGQYGDPGDNLVRIKTPSGREVVVHKDAAPSFEGFLGDLERSGYKINSIGGYNDRNIRGSSRLSQHAYGNALDINPDQNPQYGGTNMPRDVSDMAAKWGLSWGGDWSARSRDPMHFEWTGRRPWLDSPGTGPVRDAARDPEDGKL